MSGNDPSFAQRWYQAAKDAAKGTFLERWNGSATEAFLDGAVGTTDTAIQTVSSARDIVSGNTDENDFSNLLTGSLKFLGPILPLAFGLKKFVGTGIFKSIILAGLITIAGNVLGSGVMNMFNNASGAEPAPEEPAPRDTTPEGAPPEGATPRATASNRPELLNQSDIREGDNTLTVHSSTPAEEQLVTRTNLRVGIPNPEDTGPYLS